jgi:hypothetical protein
MAAAAGMAAAVPAGLAAGGGAWGGFVRAAGSAILPGAVVLEMFIDTPDKDIAPCLPQPAWPAVPGFA